MRRNPTQALTAFMCLVVATAAPAADIVLTPPATGAVTVTNAAGATNRLRVGEDGIITLPGLGAVPVPATGLCLEIASGRIGTCTVGTLTGIVAGTGLTGGTITSSGTIGLAATQLLPTVACAANQVPKWSGTAWACGNDSSSAGTVTSVGAAAPLSSTGGAAPTISLAGIVPVANGGTGQSTLVTNGVLYGLGTGAVGTAVGVAGQVLTGSAGAPAFSDSLSLNGNLTLGASTPSAGNILKGANPFIHSHGAKNTFIGENAGNFTMTGQGENAAVGYQALFSNTIGIRNAASGYQALFRNTTGGGNTASGGGALSNNTSGVSNTASGNVALASNTTGGFNTALGSFALNQNVTGSRNTAIGYGAEVSTGDLTNATAIGYVAIVNASNKIRLGNVNVSVIEGQVAYTFSSDRNQKENIRAVDPRQVLEKLRAMNVASWNYIGHDPRTSRHYGPMAQDFYAAFGRDEVGTFGNETTINSGDVTGILMIGLQGVDTQVREQQRTIEAQAVKLDAQSARIDAQASHIATLERDREAQLARMGALESQAAQVAELRRETARMARLLERLDRDASLRTANR